MTDASEQAGGERPRAFVAVKLGGQSWVVDLPLGEVVIGSGADADLRLAAADIETSHAALDWNGERLSLAVRDGRGSTFVNGKKAARTVELKPGDEVSLASAQLVVGIAVPPSLVGGRRALTHHEFRERLYEELARAARGGRPTSLVMVQARPGEGGRIANEALETFRAGDVVGTYAHDEIELLLPDTPGETAQQVVERVLNASETQGAVAGLAVCPENGDNPERLMRAARSALAVARSQGSAVATPPDRKPSNALPETADPASQQLVTELRSLADDPRPMLITGEVSSGKALFARMMHRESARSDRPFLLLTCGALSDEELGRELTGDDAMLSRAEGGTLLLDEVGDLSEEGQRLALNALSDISNVRVVATTHRTLPGLVERGAFLSELYDRVAGVVVEVPPLRNRPEDIVPLARRFAAAAGLGDFSLSPGALARLRSYPWPGNVLELRNAMERAVRLAGGSEILADHLPTDALHGGEGSGRLREHVDSVERDAIVKALADSNHNQTHAAKRLGVSRRALIYKMEKYGLKPPPGSGRK